MASNNQDTYKAAAVSLIMIGALLLIDKLVRFSSLGLSWVMRKDNFVLLTAVSFLIYKRDKSVGIVLLVLWLMMNYEMVLAWLGSLSGYLVPLAPLLAGVVLLLIAKRL